MIVGSDDLLRSLCVGANSPGRLFDSTGSECLLACVCFLTGILGREMLELLEMSSCSKTRLQVSFSNRVSSCLSL